MTNQEIAELVLRYLDLIFRWPVAIVMLGLTAMLLFKKPISDFLSRMTRAEGYGFKVNAASQEQRGEAVKKPDTPELANVVDQVRTPAPAGEHQAPPLVPQQAIQYVQQHPAQVIEEFLRVFNGYRFERALNLLYGTQIDLLQFLASKGAQGEEYTNLTPFYEEFRRRIGQTKYQMPDYVRFLHHLGFTEYVGQAANPQFKLRITPSGLGFLSYIRGEYPQTYALKPF